MSYQAELMVRLVNLGCEAAMYEQAMEGCANTAEEFQRYQDTSIRLWDRFYTELALNDISLEAYDAWCDANVKPKLMNLQPVPVAELPF